MIRHSDDDRSFEVVCCWHDLGWIVMFGPVMDRSGLSKCSLNPCGIVRSMLDAEIHQSTVDPEQTP